MIATVGGSAMKTVKQTARTPEANRVSKVKQTEATGTVHIRKVRGSSPLQPIFT